MKTAVTEWSLELSGLTCFALNRTAFEAAAAPSEHGVVLNITRKGETHAYQGLPVWVAISIVDGGGEEDREGNHLFNGDLAREGYDVRITGADGFSATMNSSLLSRNDRIILAYLEDGEILPEGDGPLKLVGEQLTGKQMVKQIVSIELILPMNWTVDLSGLGEMVLNSTTFQSTAACSGYGEVLNLTRKGETHTYRGLPLWIVVAFVDGGDSDGRYLFNDALAESGYEINITAADGFTATLNSTFIRRNDKIVLAYLQDDVPLPEGDGPLKLVGEQLTGKQMVKQIVSISMRVRIAEASPLFFAGLVLLHQLLSLRRRRRASCH